MDKNNESCCPKCSGTSGHRHLMTETHAMHGAWGESAEASDSGMDVRCSLVSCLDCGAKFQLDALVRRGLA